MSTFEMDNLRRIKAVSPNKGWVWMNTTPCYSFNDNRSNVKRVNFVKMIPPEFGNDPTDWFVEGTDSKGNTIHARAHDTRVHSPVDYYWPH